MRRRLPLRAAFAGMIAAIALGATVTLALLASRETSERLRREIGADLAELATHLADTLDRGMFERWRDIQVVASLDTIRDPSISLDAKRTVIDRLRSTYPDYAAIAIMSPQGRVVTATVPGMAGVDVTAREFFIEGSKRPFVGDVRDALLLAKILGNDPANPPRFVDVAAPIRADDGTFLGVVGAHLYWSWAEEMEQALRNAAQARHPDIDVLVLARDGTVLLGPKDLLRSIPTTASARGAVAGAKGSSVEVWPDGRNYLAGHMRTRGYRDYPGLGWSVIVRQNAASAFDPVAEVQRRIALWGALVALCAAIGGWYAAETIAGPLRALAKSARALGRGEPVAVHRGAPSEVGEMADALADASRELEARASRQALLMNELNHRVKNTLATVQSMSAATARSAQSPEAYKASLEKRIIALSKTHDLLTQASWEAVSLRDVLRAELRPYENDEGGRVELVGPPVPLAPRVAVALGMAAHELATNAAKHGSLSVPEGRVLVRWEVVTNEAASHLHLTWKETSGPPVASRGHKGFGSRLLEQGIARELDGETHLDFAVDGLGCRMLVSLGDSVAVDVPVPGLGTVRSGDHRLETAV